MSIFTRYLTREITKCFFIVLAVVITIYLTVDFFENIDKFLKADVPTVRTFYYFLFKVPLIFYQMLPVALLLAVLITFGIMSKRNEIIALRSSGVSIYHLFKSVAVLAVLGAALMFFLSEMVVPAATTRSNRIKQEEVKGHGLLKTRENLWVEHERSIFKIGKYDPSGPVMSDITVYEFNDRFQLERRLAARRAEYENDGWILEDLYEQTIDPSTGTSAASFDERRKVALSLAPDNEDLQWATPKLEEMSCKTLLTKIKAYEAEGADTVRYRVYLHYKIALPMACLIMCLIGTGIAVRGKHSAGLPVIISYGIGIMFLYFIVLSFCVTLGYAGTLPPVAAAWAANFIFLCFGGWTLINAE